MKTDQNFKPSPQVAAELTKNALYGVPIEVADGITLVLANNAKDYTGPGTNTYVVGDESVWIIDPGPDDRAHINAVLRAVDRRPVRGILITHTHLDHSPAAEPLKRLTGARTYGFGALSTDILAMTDEDVDDAFQPDEALSCGRLLGKGRWQVMALHTPGHFPNHMCFVLPHDGVLFSGDHVMGWSTTVVVPPLGHLGEYMASLDKLEAGGARLMLPSHGPAVQDPGNRIREVRDHRLMRHRQVATCLEQGIKKPQDIVAEIYQGLTPRLLEAAEGCVRAHIEFLQDGEPNSDTQALGHPRLYTSGQMLP